jgi:hypothetical protein
MQTNFWWIRLGVNFTNNLIIVILCKYYTRRFLCLNFFARNLAEKLLLKCLWNLISPQANRRQRCCSFSSTELRTTLLVRELEATSKFNALHCGRARPSKMAQKLSVGCWWNCLLEYGTVLVFFLQEGLKNNGLYIFLQS